MAEIISNNIIAGIFLSIIFGTLSVFVILRKLSFLGVGISHSAFAGVSLALLLNTDIFITTLIFSLVVAFLIGKTTKMGKMEYENSIGLFFSFSMAMGAIFLFLNRNYNFDIMGYLFGSILGITDNQVMLIAIFSLLFTSVIIIFFKEFIFMAFDEEVAFTSGINTNFFDNILLIMLTAIIVSCLKLIGIILVSALLILPGSFSLIICRDYKMAFIVSIFYALFIYFSGFAISWFWDLPPGATIVSVGSIGYFITMLLSRRSKL